ncbi:hypothetical protein SASPL_108198 [Salvia splendens]|uniref:Replication protein A 70 kDa DNA-binding subunit B/D first OB fold domain-containing protein n=1 Tax=Salvia splendens TaxID=180675 RepID=A0A8X9A780_SALSN|nr:hypothetical protein SASPL_108198 [Salvia splendens]
MSPFVTCLNNLSKAITTSTIKVRCVRRYEGVPEDKNDNNLECVLHDDVGTRIQASFTNNIMQKMASPLREGGVFYIKNFLVQSNTLKNKATNHQFRLVMNSYTEMFEVKDLAFPRMMFSFKPFPEISQMRHYDETSFFDVIGVITNPGRVLNQSNYVRPVLRRLRQRIISLTVHYVLPMEDIAKEIEKKLVGQSVLFKLQFRNQLEYYKSYPHTVNKVCIIPHVVEKYTPQKLGSQEVRKELKLSDLIFGSDLPEVYQKSIVTPDLSSLTNEIILNATLKALLRDAWRMILNA